MSLMVGNNLLYYTNIRVFIDHFVLFLLNDCQFNSYLIDNFAKLRVIRILFSFHNGAHTNVSVRRDAN